MKYNTDLLSHFEVNEDGTVWAVGYDGEPLWVVQPAMKKRGKGKGKKCL